MPRLIAALTALVLGMLSLGAATPATAAKRTAPFGFFGTVLDPAVGEASPEQLSAQTALMARSGVESLRFTVNWSAVEPTAGARNWATVDGIVAAAASRRINLLANVINTPYWATSNPGDPTNYRWAPRDPVTFGTFMTALVQRYGPKGAFWTANPSIPKTPIRQWQVWNEQGTKAFWQSSPWPSTYTTMLKAGYKAVHAADRNAQVVAGSVVGYGKSTPWSQMRQLYRAGARKAFDVVSVHAFTNNPKSVSDSVDRVVEIVRRVRAEMRRAGDAKKPIIMTELTWPAALGKVPKERLLGLETTTTGQRQRMAAVYRRLVKDRRRIGVSQAYWYTWASSFDATDPLSDVSYRFAGLNRYSGGVFTPQPPLAEYARVAARYEGCRKGSSARSCRR